MRAWIEGFASALITISPGSSSAARRAGQAKVDERGVHGLGPSSDDRRIRLLVTEDRGYDVRSALLENARAGMVDVFATAARCARLVDGDPAWRAETVTAMICRELQTVPAVSLPGELTLRPVRRLTEDAPDGVPLKDAVAAARLADPRINDPGALADFLRSLPPAIRLFVAVDGDGVVRATAGSGAFGTHASVVFVNTDPTWRGRGVGRAMTAAALRAAVQSGARHAGLDATEAGLGSTSYSDSRSSLRRRASAAAADRAVRLPCRPSWRARNGRTTAPRIVPCTNARRSTALDGVGGSRTGWARKG